MIGSKTKCGQGLRHIFINFSLLDLAYLLTFHCSPAIFLQSQIKEVNLSLCIGLSYQFN